MAPSLHPVHICGSTIGTKPAYVRSSGWPHHCTLLTSVAVPLVPNLLTSVVPDGPITAPCSHLWQYHWYQTCLRPQFRMAPSLHPVNICGSTIGTKPAYVRSSGWPHHCTLFTSVAVPLVPNLLTSAVPDGPITAPC